jgi:hypothetical protein
MKKVAYLFIPLAIVAMIGFAFFQIHAVQVLHKAFSPKYVELDTEKLQGIEKEQIANVAISAINQHKESASLWEGTISIFKETVWILSSGLVVLLLISIILLRRSSNK